MASMRDIKRRRTSIENTQQITKAMKLVSTVKLQRAKTRAEQSKYYFNSIYDTVTSILAKSEGINHPYLKAGENGKKVVIVITSNKGLAGGYNANIIKMVTRNPEFTPDNTKIYVIGKKAKDARNMQVDAVSGATYSSKAVIKNVHLALDYYQKNK